MQLGSARSLSEMSPHIRCFLSSYKFFFLSYEFTVGTQILPALKKPMSLLLLPQHDSVWLRASRGPVGFDSLENYQGYGKADLW